MNHIWTICQIEFQYLELFSHTIGFDCKLQDDRIMAILLEKYVREIPFYLSFYINIYLCVCKWLSIAHCEQCENFP